MSEGVSDPALALFGPLRAGSLTPTCLVSVLLQIAARTRAGIVARLVPSRCRDLVSCVPDNVAMIVGAHNVVP